MASGFSFGAQSSAPPAFGQTTGFNLGGVAPNTTAPSFGQLGAAQPAAPTLGMGAPAFNFAATPAMQATPAPTMPFAIPTTAPPSMGQQTALPNLFGAAPVASIANPLTGGLSFNPPNTSAPTLGGLNFAATPAATTSSLFSGLTGMSTPLAGAGLNKLPTASTAPAPSFNFAPSLPSKLTFGPPRPASTAPSLTFQTPQQPVSSTLTLGSLVPVATSTSTPISFGNLGGLKPTTSFTTVTTTSAPPVGLGGTASIQTKVTTSQSETAAKDQVLPHELLETVESYKKFVKEQKDFSSEIARFSVKDLLQVDQNIGVVQGVVNEMESQLEKNRLVAQKLKMDTSEGLQYVEMAQRTMEIPAGLQYENNAPFQVFANLANKFEKDVQALKAQVQNIDKIVCSRNVPSLSSDDLSMAMKHLHDTFIALAGRLHSVHAQVDQQKRQYLDLRKHILHDSTNVFEVNTNNDIEVNEFSSVYQPPKAKVGPTPFTTFGRSQVQVMAENSTSIPPTNVGFSSLSNSFAQSAMPFNLSNSNNFQLQKPPLGSKRGLQR